MKPKYTSFVGTPMKFYKFLKILLPIICVLGIINACLIYSQYSQISQFYTYPVFWIDIVCHAILLLLIFLSAYHLPRLNWLGVQSYGVYLTLTIAYQSIISATDPANADTSPLAYILSGVILLCLFLIPYSIYFKKRRLLFAPYPTAHSTPAIPAEKNIDDSKEPETPVSEPLKSKKPIFDRYDTYIVCPGCGSMVAKGAKKCDCGYDLTSPISRLIRKAAPILLGLVICAGIGIAGFFLGQRSMDGKLLDQYLIGYDEGHAVGYEAGTAESEANYSEVFEDGYRTGISNYVTNSYGMTNFATETWRFDFDGRDELNCSLGEEYDFRKYNGADSKSGGTLIPTNPFLK